MIYFFFIYCKILSIIFRYKKSIKLCRESSSSDQFFKPIIRLRRWRDSKDS